MEKKERLDKEVAKRFNLSRNKIKELLDKKLVFVNSKCIKKGSFLTSTNDIITLKEEVVPSFKPLFAKVQEKITEEKNGYFFCDTQPKNNEIVVIFQNDDFIVILKGSNVLSHSSNTKVQSSDVSSSLIKNGYLLNAGPSDRLGIVHRLDEDTKGLMIIAKTNEAFDELKQMFKNKNISRKYLGICHGPLKEEKIIIKGKILNDFRNNQMIIDSDGKVSKTHAKMIFYDEDRNISLNEFILETGRTHQIRIHMAKIGNPILGDKKYGKKQDVEMMLFSYFLKFRFKERDFLFTFRPIFNLKDETSKKRINKISSSFVSD